MKRPAVFFDRDNTLIACDGYLGDPAKVELIDGAAEAVARVREMGFAVVVFSNQSGVARGMFGEDAVHAVNHRLDDLLREEDPQAIIDRHDFCPYHPTAKVERYRKDSDLRKPRPGMIYQAAAVLGLDLERSWAVGDAPRDVAAGHAAGLKTVLLKIASLPPSPATNEGAGVEPDFVASSLAEAMDFIEIHKVSADEEQWKEADAGEPVAVGAESAETDSGSQTYGGDHGHRNSSNGHRRGGEADAASRNLPHSTVESDRFGSSDDVDREHGEGEEAFLDGAIPERERLKLAAVAENQVPDSPGTPEAQIPTSKVGLTGSNPMLNEQVPDHPAVSEPAIEKTSETGEVTEVESTVEDDRIVGSAEASSANKTAVTATEAASDAVAAADVISATSTSEPMTSASSPSLEESAQIHSPVEMPGGEGESTIAIGETDSVTVAEVASEEPSDEAVNSADQHGISAHGTAPIEDVVGMGSRSTESVRAENFLSVPTASAETQGVGVVAAGAGQASRNEAVASVVDSGVGPSTSPVASEDSVKLSPRPSHKPDSTKPMDATTAPAADASKRVPGGFVVRPNQAPQMTWGERMRMAKTSGVVWPNGRPAEFDVEPVEPVAETPAAPPVEPEPVPTPPARVEPAVEPVPEPAAVASTPAPEQAAERADESASSTEMPKRGLRREELAAQEVAMNGTDPADEAADQTTRRRARTSAASDGSRSEELLEQILLEMRRREEQASLDFSVSKLLAGITQILALFAMVWAYFSSNNSYLLPMLMVAQLLQTLTISLFIMGRQK